MTSVPHSGAKSVTPAPSSLAGGEVVSVPALTIDACKGEQEHFEAWAKSKRYEMSEHPLHYIFNDPKTDAARMGWNAALAYVREAALSPEAPAREVTAFAMNGPMTTHPTLRSANIARQDEWDQDGQITASYRGNELAGEVGEACNVIKKLERERLGILGSRATVGELADELADVLICADLIAMHYGIDLEAAVARKFNATSEKVGLQTRLATPNDGGEA